MENIGCFEFIELRTDNWDTVIHMVAFKISRIGTVRHLNQWDLNTVVGTHWYIQLQINSALELDPCSRIQYCRMLRLRRPLSAAKLTFISWQRSDVYQLTKAFAAETLCIIVLLLCESNLYATFALRFEYVHCIHISLDGSLPCNGLTASNYKQLCLQL